MMLFVVLLHAFVSSKAQELTSMKDKYVMVIDIQEIATQKSPAPDVAQRLIDNVNRVIELADPEKVIR